MPKHALFSPSGFKALMLCPAKPAMEQGRADEASEYADEGTAAHYLAAECLRGPMTPEIGDVIAVHPEGECDWLDGIPNNRHPESRYFTVTADFAAHVQSYVDLVRSRIEMYRQLGAQEVELYVEQSVPIGHITGEDEAEGTADAVIVAVFADRVVVEVIDLKFGRGVEVSAEDNPQLKLYALGAIEKLCMVYDFTHASMLICQPRAGGTSEAQCTVDELQAWAREVATPAAHRAAGILFGGEPMDCRPHEDACRFCRAKGDCQALANTVQTAMQREFTDLTTADELERDAIVETSIATAEAAGDLGAKMDAVPLVEMWCKAIRARVEKQLLEGKPVAGYKLVEGKRGARQWADDIEAEKKLKGMRLKKEQMYDFKLISPTSAEKLLKATPKRWKALQALITQNDGKASVAPISDKRPALQVKPLESEFTPITETSPATADDLV